jgi:hypothetical protein
MLRPYMRGRDGREHEKIFAGHDFGGMGVGGGAADLGRLQYAAEFDEIVSGTGGDWGAGERRADEVRRERRFEN